MEEEEDTKQNETMAFNRDQSENESDVEKIIIESPHPPRGKWNSRVEFFLSCVSMSVGLGNIWRFPYLCFKNGGGAFLIPFTITMCLIGLPLFFMELALGQFASLGAIGVWNISPMFKGVGYGMVIISAITAVYYNVIIAQCLYYFGVSFTSSLPWSNCNNSWNNQTLCHNILDNSSSIFSSNQSIKLFPSEEYYENYVLNKSKDITDMGLPQWRLTLCLIVAWIFVTVIVIKGVKIMGKVAYFTALFPYIILTILLIRGLMLPGSIQGIIYYISPDFKILKKPKVWVEAATQIFFSLGVCNGNLMTMSSYNEFKNDCCRDAIIFAVIDCLTSVYAGFVIFANMGFMANVMNVTIKDVVKEGPGLAFKVYPEALTKLPLSPLWSVLFFFMMITLGFGSQIALVETVLSSLQDELRRWKIMTTNLRITIYRISVCVILFLIGIPMTCRGGMYLLELFDTSISGYSMLIIAMVELVVISYVYGVKRFAKDVKLMIGYRPNIFWQATWMAITPIFIGLLIISLIIFSYNEIPKFPPGFMSLQHILTLSPIAVMVIIFLKVYCAKGGWTLLMEIRKPLHYWGPATDSNKESFIQSLTEINGSDSKKNNFFQSKESLAEKFRKRASLSNGDSKLIDNLAGDYLKSNPKSDD